MDPNLVNDDTLARKQTDRFYYMENMTLTNIALGLSMSIFGVLVHINLQLISGEVIILIGIMFGLLALLAGFLYMLKPHESEKTFLQTRLYFLYAKYCLFLALLVTTTYVAAVMFQRNGKQPSQTPVNVLRETSDEIMTN